MQGALGLELGSQDCDRQTDWWSLDGPYCHWPGTSPVLILG